MSDHDANSNNGSTDSSNDSLNGSWVKLEDSDKNGSEHPFSIHNGKMEDLLAEAVEDESRANGTCPDRKSVGPATPSEVETTEIVTEGSAETKVSLPVQHSHDCNWIEDWSSRVEPHPPKKWRLTYPTRKDRTSYIERIQSDKSTNTNFIKLNFYIVIPTLLITHVIAFGIGVYLGRRSTSGSTSV